MSLLKNDNPTPEVALRRQRVRESYQRTREKRLAYHKNYYEKNLERSRAWARPAALARLRNRRKQILDALGNKCACCGESEIRFLSIDHIHGGGCAERRLRSSGLSYYKWIIDQGIPKDKYQILCHNCNLAKGYHGICPHEIGRRLSLVS